MTPAEAASAADLGSASARKAGRNPKWPHVPIVLTTDDSTGRVTEHQVLGLAYATREEAVHAAQIHIDRQRAELERKLEMPNYRALRAQHGVDDELDADQSTDSTDARWYAYKRAEAAAGREPMTWGDWLRAGQPVPVTES